MDSLLSSSKLNPDSIHVDGVGNVEIRTSKRAKHLKLAISARNGVYVVKPKGVSNRAAKRLIVANEDWLKKRLAKMPGKLILEPDIKFSRVKILKVANSETVQEVLIAETATELLLSLPANVKLHDKSVQDELMERVVKIWRKESKIYLPKRLQMLSEVHGLSFNDVRAKYMHTRWGSCSSKNNINLNIQLMRLKPELIDHVLRHELAHTKEHNHSKAFWALFASLEPDARATSKLLKSHQLF